MTKTPNVNKQDLPAKADKILSKDSRNAIRCHGRGQRHFKVIGTSFGFRIFDLSRSIISIICMRDGARRSFRVSSLGFRIFPL